MNSGSCRAWCRSASFYRVHLQLRCADRAGENGPASAHWTANSMEFAAIHVTQNGAEVVFLSALPSGLVPSSLEGATT